MNCVLACSFFGQQTNYLSFSFSLFRSFVDSFAVILVLILPMFVMQLITMSVYSIFIVSYIFSSF